MEVAWHGDGTMRAFAPVPDGRETREGVVGPGRRRMGRLGCFGRARKGKVGLLPSLFYFYLKHFLFVLFSERKKGRKRNRKEGKKRGEIFTKQNI